MIEKILKKNLAPTIFGLIVSYCPPQFALGETIKIAGDSFSEGLYNRYIEAYRQQTGKTFEYVTVGNAGGIRLFTNKTVDLGVTSLIPTPIEINQMKDGLVMVPVAGGSIAIVYHLEDVSQNITLSREQILNIFTGQITNWQQINPKLPYRDIRIITCSNNCSSNFILTKYIHKISKRKIEASKNPQWNFRVFASFPEDNSIAGEIKRIDGSIGYVATNIARENQLNIASVENEKGNYFQPDLDAIELFFATKKFNNNLTINDDSSLEDGYPLATLTWLIINQKFLNKEALNNQKYFLNWLFTEGQKLNETFGYTKMPENINNKIKEEINDKLKFNSDY